MKIRVMGTKAECEQAQRFYNHFAQCENVSHCTASGLYPNRGSVNQYRVYIEIACKDETTIFNDLLPKVVD